MARKDISDVLNDWPFDPESLNVRRIQGDDDQDKIQLRLDLGLLQMEADGRPDGERPYDFENALIYYQNELERVVEETGSEKNFTLDSEALAELQQESIQYYHRYLCFSELNDHKGVIRDTKHNLEVLEFVENNSVEEDEAWSFLQYYPYILMMNTQAHVQLALETESFEDAMERIEQSLQLIRGFNEKWGLKESEQSQREIQILEEWKATVLNKRPVSKYDQLQAELEEAVELEKYERAAQLRDQIEHLQQQE